MFFAFINLPRFFVFTDARSMSGQYATTTTQFYITDVACAGTESVLFDCPGNRSQSSECSSSRESNVNCQGEDFIEVYIFRVYTYLQLEDV